MDWMQTFTIIFTIIGSMVAVWYAFYHIIKEDIKRHDEELKVIRQETREEFSRVHAEFSKVHSLWANLLEKIGTLEKQILEIKLDQSRKI